MSEIKLPHVDGYHISALAIVFGTIFFSLWLIVGYHTMTTSRIAEQISLTNRNTAMAITLAVAVSSSSNEAKQEILAATCPQMKEVDVQGNRDEETMESTVCQALLKVFRANNAQEKNEMLEDLLKSQKGD